MDKKLNYKPKKRLSRQRHVKVPPQLQPETSKAPAPRLRQMEKEVAWANEALRKVRAPEGLPRLRSDAPVVE